MTASGRHMSKLHLVFGGRVKDPRGLDFSTSTRSTSSASTTAIAAAEDAWRGKAQRTVDDAEMKYVIVHLHRLLEPDGEGTCQASPGRSSRAEPQAVPIAPQQQRALQQQPGDEAADVRRRREQIALPAGEPADHHLQHDPGDQQPDDIDPAVDPAERVTRLARPKLSAKAPITALIAPLAPTIGTIPCGSASHCATAAA